MSSPLYLLDTNILVHYVRASAVWERVRGTHRPLTAEPRPIISAATAGELRSLAIQWAWGQQKLDQVEFVLAYFQSVMIGNADLIRMYATIDAFCEGTGQSLGKNDLWIAATAAVTGATLLTTDRDFDRLTPRFITRDWIDPDIPTPTA
ncbi:MAG: PIN domain-containing protein [Planctomycetes bacterium]|nr:PIN domain-containing protein [Planctomycetota bacterium]